MKYIRITDFDDDGIPPGHEFVTAEELDERYILEEEDILFARSGATAGKTFIYKKDLGPSIFAGYCIRFRFDKSRILPWFVYFYTKTSRYRAWVRSIQRPSGQPNINKEEFKSFSIPVPPLERQQALVNLMIASRESRKAKLFQADSLLPELGSFLYDQLGITLPPQKDNRWIYSLKLSQYQGGRCDALYYLPRYLKIMAALRACSHPLVPLGELSPEITGGATPTRGDAELYAESGIKFLRIMNITPYEIDLTDIKYIKENVHNQDLARSRLSEGDILMTITGRVGTATVVPKDILPANINQHIVRLRVRSDVCLPAYLAVYLNSSVGLALSNRGVTGGTRIALDYDAIRNLLIPLPPKKIQEIIVVELDRRLSLARALHVEAVKNWDGAKMKLETQLLSS
jgi:restriction endonuclease S subunit